MDRMDWFGAKRVVKNVLNARPINAMLIGTLRHLPPSTRLARLPVSVPEVVGSVAGIRYVLTNPARCSIAKEIFWGRGQRVNRSEQLSLEIVAALARSSDRMFDIGANTGIFSLVAAKSNAAIHVDAFEIVPEVFEILFRNVVRNDVAAQVTCHFAGVDKEGHTTRVPWSLNASSIPLSYSATMRAESGATVPFHSLDKICEGIPDATKLVMKIDVEATEATLFANAWRAIERLHPWMICEILVGAPGTKQIEFALARYGYRFFKITDDGLSESPSIDADARFHDWLFAPADEATVRARTTVT